MPNLASSLTFLLALLLLTGCGDTGQTQLTRADELLNDEAAIARGRSLFIGTCAGYCHKLTREAVDAPYLFDCEWRHGGSDDEIFAIVTNGVPDTRMVGFGNSFPEGEDDLWKIIAFLKSDRQPCA